MKWTGFQWSCFIISTVIITILFGVVVYADHNGVDIFDATTNPIFATMGYVAAITSLVLMVIFAASITNARSRLKGWRGRPTSRPSNPADDIYEFILVKTLYPGMPIALFLTVVVAAVGQCAVDLGTFHGEQVWSWAAIFTGYLFLGINVFSLRRDYKYRGLREL